MACDNRVKNIRNCVASYPDFPKEGITFRDIFPVLRNPSAFEDLISLICDSIKNKVDEVDGVLGLESRGFLIGTPVALRLKVPFIPIRKSGKLPGKLRQVKYALEYGTSSFEIQEDSITPNKKYVILDDLLATGGTLEASINLVEMCGAKVSLCVIVIELVDLQGSKKARVPVHSLLQF